MSKKQPLPPETKDRAEIRHMATQILYKVTTEKWRQSSGGEGLRILSFPARSRHLDGSQEDGEEWAEIGEEGHARRAEQRLNLQLQEEWQLLLLYYCVHSQMITYAAGPAVSFVSNPGDIHLGLPGMAYQSPPVPVSAWAVELLNVWTHKKPHVNITRNPVRYYLLLLL